jgi:hypothetical protein
MSNPPCTGSPFDEPVIGMPHHLLDNVVQVFALAGLHALVFIGIVLFYSRRIGSAFINVDQAGFAARSNSLFEESTCGLLITPGRQ